MNTLQFCLLVVVIQTASGFQLLNRKPATFTRHSKNGHLQVSHQSSTSCYMITNAGSNSSSHSSKVFQSSGNEDITGCCIPAAHGLICPETIANMAKEARKNPVIQRFVETYHRYGPLACEDMLSDPDILPHLTKAMRDIA